ncbi:uncharacterized protein B0I36DRAFT_34136 [Microdochium trichocladiopsis]|uniref:TLC domain-containing protein n=1 Tax=Microdochium trichocladiopsis TaxID=1682393 RepID=A0A9P8XWT1_9PEZI|nr:uncharacterized protein B0I36DRAFT_34136 [Microdochium trichocladiopsis]KAH7021633.1 hypothetical protein B0I36DRAFT_34136 [Microdochium trichocladiopsis]
MNEMVPIQPLGSTLSLRRWADAIRVPLLPEAILCTILSAVVFFLPENLLYSVQMWITNLTKAIGISSGVVYVKIIGDKVDSERFTVLATGFYIWHFPFIEAHATVKSFLDRFHHASFVLCVLLPHLPFLADQKRALTELPLEFLLFELTNIPYNIGFICNDLGYNHAAKICRYIRFAVFLVVRIVYGTYLATNKSTVLYQLWADSQSILLSCVLSLYCVCNLGQLLSNITWASKILLKLFETEEEGGARPAAEAAATGSRDDRLQ